MLVLTRKPEERVFIGTDIMVQVVQVKGNQVRLGITAPPGCLILREEVKEQINGIVRQDQKKSSKKAQAKRTKDQTPKRR